MMDADRLKEILDNHALWREGQGGERAYLQGADLRGADLQGANLRGANLRGADLQDADLRGAYLRGAYLQGANLRGAYLRGAYLQDADLQDADLQGANLQDADLRGAYHNYPICCPDSGAFIGWKKVNGGLIVKLQVAEDAKRSSATSRKCRCSKATVLGIEHANGTPADVTEASSTYDANFMYRIGETVEVTDFNEDRWNECSAGIHFFITRQEAVDY